jgi:hypothetical protein
MVGAGMCAEQFDFGEDEFLGHRRFEGVFGIPVDVYIPRDRSFVKSFVEFF